METAVAWLLVIGPMLIGLGAAIWWGSGSKVVGLWSGFVPGAIVLVIAAALQTQIAVSKPDAAVTPKNNPLRAYVFPDHNEVHHPQGKPATVIINIKNSGQTPAYEITWRANFVVATVDMEGKLEVDQDVPAPKQILAQGGFLSYAFTFATDQWKPEFDELIKQEKIAIFAVGEIRYKDLDGKDRYTNYVMKSGGRFGTRSGIAPGRLGAVSIKSN